MHTYIDKKQDSPYKKGGYNGWEMRFPHLAKGLQKRFPIGINLKKRVITHIIKERSASPENKIQVLMNCEIEA